MEENMITEIGIVAGDIWHYLDQHGEVTLTALLKGIDKNRDNVLMSLGWLAREGHVVVLQAGSDYKVYLRKNA
ncbi:MAG: winged helix-turn-helix domain-containing protein [Candidatus Omnitrophica bacterium]|jgi:hypothetical protein|nr:winged helix-turn-helix domain-containing protein [Candidatus Omnitrophota bacterium]